MAQKTSTLVRYLEIYNGMTFTGTPQESPVGENNLVLTIETELSLWPPRFSAHYDNFMVTPATQQEHSTQRQLDPNIKPTILTIPVFRTGHGYGGEIGDIRAVVDGFVCAVSMSDYVAFSLEATKAHKTTIFNIKGI